MLFSYHLLYFCTALSLIIMLSSHYHHHKSKTFSQLTQCPFTGTLLLFIYCTYFYLINWHFYHDFRVCFHLPPYLQEVGISKCRNTVFLPDWPKLHPGKCFMMSALKGTFFPQQILNKNRLCLAHCALNRSFTVIAIFLFVAKLWRK